MKRQMRLMTVCLLASWLGSAWADGSGPLVDAAWILENGCWDGVVILDVRSDLIDGESRADYEKGHIKVDPQAPQVAFCNTGHLASLGWFVSSELLGNPQVRLYDGSMADWSRAPDLPIERRAVTAE